jgi:hypothetical protein
MRSYNGGLGVVSRISMGERSRRLLYSSQVTYDFGELCGPLANSRFHHRPDPQHQPASKLEAAYHRADNAIQQIVELLAA